MRWGEYTQHEQVQFLAEYVRDVENATLADFLYRRDETAQLQALRLRDHTELGRQLEAEFLENATLSIGDSLDEELDMLDDHPCPVARSELAELMADMRSDR
jgi:hypothetical protein